MSRVYNFAAGPAAMPEKVLEWAQRDLMEYGTSGMSVMEMSHRSKMYQEIFDQSVADIRELMNIPENYEVLFLQGGATTQFSAIPLNLMVKGKADYIDSGNFAHLAAEEAKRYGQVNIAGSTRATGYTAIPELSECKFDPDADYLYICGNNTIYGTRYAEWPEVNVPVVADISSMILSQEIDVTKFGVLYGGTQKNLGPSGLAVVIVRKDLLGNANPLTPVLMNWKVQADKGSMYNTPNTWGIYIAGLTFKWLKELGGVKVMQQINEEKAALLYDYLDESKLFKPTAEKKYRSLMNVTFVTGNEEKDAAFVKAATAAGFVNLKGHRSVGGMRASIYNAMPNEGVKKLVDFMKQFEADNA